ncbi:hypothetical protein [Streptosporangium canum]|uniref:hypothetical protein n=1 Tax=Streptosporangium canum TaxID=324952 RepID=UPI0037A95F31
MMRVGLLGLGRIGAFHAATLAAHPWVDELVVADADAARAAEGLQPPGEPWPDFRARFEAAYVAEMGAFPGTARGETDSPCTVEDALAALYLAEAAELSRHEGRPVRTAEVIS